MDQKEIADLSTLRIAGVKIFVAAIFSKFIYSWLLLAQQVKVGKVASFVGKIFVLQCSTTKTTNILPHKSY